MKQLELTTPHPRVRKRVLVISPHPDDETIGCGGAICRHLQTGDSVEVVFLTSGEKGGHGLSPTRCQEVREGEAKAAAKILGIPKINFWRLPDGALRATVKSIRQLRQKLQASRPHIIYVTHDREMHPDHRAAARLLGRACQGLRFRPEVRMFEVWTPLQEMDEIIDITAYISKKVAAIRAYRSQESVVGFAEAIRGLNRYRGEMHSWPGGDYAEIFKRLPV